MQTLARLFGRSPFAPLQTHMEKVTLCVRELPPLFEALADKDYQKVEEIGNKISQLEHDADLLKNDIRNHLPSGLFLPIARESLLEILSLQDNIADHAEDTGILLTFCDVEIHPFFTEEFNAFLKKNVEAFEGAHKIIKEMGELLESSFGGSEAEKVKKLVHEVAFMEHECDLLQRKLLKKIFGNSEQMTTASFFLWTKIIKVLASLSNESEKLANRVRMTLEVK